MDDEKEWTSPELRDAMIAALDKEYELVYISYDDQLRIEQVKGLVSGDWEEVDGDARFGEWESDARYEGAKYVIEELIKDLDAEAFVLEPEDRDEVRFAIEERDRSNPIKDLARNTPHVMVRYRVVSVEDDDMQDEGVEEWIAERLGVDYATYKEKIDSLVANASPRGSEVLSLYFPMDPEDLYDLMNEKIEAITVENADVLLMCHYNGSGYCEEIGPFSITLPFDRDRLHLDSREVSDGGYSWDETCGGVHIPAFHGKAKFLTKEQADQQKLEQTKMLVESLTVIEQQLRGE